MDYYDDDPTGDDEVTALWNGQLPMDSVLKVLQREIEQHKAAQARIAELEAQLASATVRFIDGVGYLTLPEPVATAGVTYYDAPPAATE